MSTNPQTVYKLFNEVRALPEAAREPYLLSQCHDRPELLEAVRQVLSGREGLLSFLDREPGFQGETVVLHRNSNRDQLQFELNDQTISPEFMIGPYRPIEQIGEGGMGIVYRAIQYEPVRREVALKVIKPGPASKEVVARFEAERQALALMDHAHIARVFDGGTTDDGRPYFAMELVRGIPITEYCNLNQLNNIERLNLFRTVCDAVQHAHQKGIIHRDLKPSNIMVTSEDDEPRVKIIDFGIAKALSQSLTDRTLLTGVLSVVGTPMYMSPEQADLPSDDHDTRSDVYSLGVLLYELLTGLLPLEMKTLTGSRVEEYLRTIRETEPKRPSARISSLDEEKLAILSRQRSVEARKLAMGLRGELDWIVMKAIEKDRSRRYQSARELSQDLERYLAGEPVLASPQSTLYRIRKYCRRHRVVMVTTTLVVLALFIGFTTALTQAFRATRAEQEVALTAGQLAGILYSVRMEQAFSRYFDGEYDQVDQILNGPLPESSQEADLRGYEWYLLKNLPKISHTRLLQMEGIVRTLAHHRPTHLLAAGSSLGEIVLFDLETSARLAGFTGCHDGELYDLCFINDRLLASCGRDGTVAVWELVSREKLEEKYRVTFEDEPIYAVSYDKHQHELVAAGEGQKVYGIDLNSHDVRDRSPSFGSRIEVLLVTPAGGLLVGNYDGSVHHIGAGQTHPSLTFAEKTNMGGIKDLAFLGRSNLAVAGQLLGQITLFDESSPGNVRFSQTFPADVHSVAITTDGKWIAAGGSNGDIFLMPAGIEHGAGFLESGSARRRRMRIWNVHTGKVEQLLFLPANKANEPPVLLSSGCDGAVCLSRPFDRQAHFRSLQSDVYDFGFLDDGTLLLAGCGVTARDLSDGIQELFRFGGEENWNNVRVTSQSHEVFLDRNDRTIFRTPPAQNRSKLSTPTLEPVWTAREGETAFKWAVSPGGAILALNVEFHNETGDRRHRFDLYRAGETTPLRTIFDDFTQSSNDMVFSPDGRLLAVIQNNDIWLLVPETGARLAVLTGHRDTIRDLEFSPDSQRLASVSNDRRLIYWDVNDYRELWSTTAHENRAISVAFHPTLNTLATAGEDGIVRFWRIGADVRDPESRLVGVYPLDAGHPEKLDFSPDGRNLLIRHAHKGLTVLRSAPIDP